MTKCRIKDCLGSEAIGIDGKLLKWLRNWLLDRRPRVTLKGLNSKRIRVSSGVPQGSVLGSILFLIHFYKVMLCYVKL